jgi:glycosyltransferase involved in cell wall biosynthesis
MIRADRRRATAEPALSTMRIAALVATEQVSGPGRQLTALAVGLREAGIPALIIAFHRTGRPPSAFAQYLAEAGVDHRIVEDRGPLDWRVASEVEAILEQWQPSIVQTHSYKATAVAYALRARRPAWSWAGFYHGTTHENLRARFYHWVDRRMLRAADRIVVMSREQAVAFQRSGHRVQVIDNAALIPHKVPDVSVRDSLAAFGGGFRRPLLGIVGRLSPEKGVDVFLDACAILAQQGVEFAAVIAGEGPERGRLEAQCRRLGLESRVRFVGHVATVDVLYRTLDLVVLPSRSEGLPNTLLEALQADVPVVAASVGAVPDVVGTSAAARLVAPGAPAALAEAVGLALSLGDTPEAAAARAAVVKRFSLERRVEEHLRVYRDLMFEQSRRAR